MRHTYSLAAVAGTAMLISACSAATMGTELATTPRSPKLIAGILASAEAATASEAAYLTRCGVQQHRWRVPGAAEPPRIIFDTDMGSDADDAGALALLHAYADLGRVTILGAVYSSGVVPYGAGVVEAINVYYGRAELPVGAYHGTDVGDPVDKMQAEKLARDTAAFGHRIVRNQDAENATRLVRRLLAAAPDRSVTYLTVGHTRVLYDVLVSGADDISPLEGRELILSKVERWVALGALGAANADGHRVKDWNFYFNGTAPYTAHLAAHFPAPAVFVDGGGEVMTGASLKGTPAGNIVRTAYRDWLWNHDRKTLDDQRPSWDLVAVYYAVEGTGGFLTDEGSGWLDCDVQAGCRWLSVDREPARRYVRQRAGVDEALGRYLNTMIARPPATGSPPAQAPS